MRFAFSSSLRRVGDKLLPARLMKNWIMRIPEPIPRGLTFLLAMVLAMLLASLVNAPAGGNVETVFTAPDQRLVVAFFCVIDVRSQKMVRLSPDRNAIVVPGSL